MEELLSATPILKNRYQLQKTIGNGGMAVVYLAQDMLLERKVAVKVLRKTFSENKTFQDKLKAEAKAAAMLSHPNIVTVYDFGFDAGYLFIVMEYIKGDDLKTLITKRGIFSQKEAINLMIQACEGLEYAHQAGIIHCDVKPQNLIISDDGKLYFTDFGIARALETIDPQEQHNTVWGSPLYFSPEQAAGKAPGRGSDIYSLGVILYEMITGRLPFNSDNAIELVKMHQSKKPKAPIKLNKDLSPDINNIILKTLSKEPSQRFRTAGQLRNVLKYLSIGDEGLTENNKIPRNNNKIAKSLNDTQEINKKGDKLNKDISNLGIDWTTIGLTLLAIIAVGGLIPFWIYVWFSLYPPGR
jgi:serine/threonine-protein kinase